MKNFQNWTKAVGRVVWILVGLIILIQYIMSLFSVEINYSNTVTFDRGIVGILLACVFFLVLCGFFKTKTPGFGRFTTSTLLITLALMVASVAFMFDHTCTFTLKKEDIESDLEELELELIDFEVEEVFDDEEGVIIYAPFEQFGAIQSFFEENNVEILSSGFERIPTTTSKLTEVQQEDVDKLLEKLEDDDDVQNVYHSMEM